MTISLMAYNKTETIYVWYKMIKHIVRANLKQKYKVLDLRYNLMYYQMINLYIYYDKCKLKFS